LFSQVIAQLIPDKIRRIDSERIASPECGERLIPGKHLESSQ
jgi:hypothetical protein